MLHAFPKFQLDRIQMFFPVQRFIQSNQQFVLRKQRKEADKLRTEIFHIAVQICHHAKFFHLLSELLGLHLHAVRLFQLVFLFQCLRCLFCLRFDRFQAIQLLLLCQDHFRRRIDRHCPQCFHRTLAEYIKPTDRLYLITPELNTIRIFFCQIINIDNTAANGKLPRFFYLISLFVAHLYELHRNRFFLHDAFRRDRDTVFLQHLQWQAGRKKRIHCRYDRQRLLFQNPAIAADPFLCHLLSADIRLKENVILGRKQYGIFIKKGIILI